jgi:flagellar basal body-associated protein FliL
MQYMPAQESSKGLIALILLLVLALIGVVVYFMVFDKKHKSLITSGGDDLVTGTTYMFSTNDFTSELTINKSGSDYTFTTTDGEEYNFDLKTPPKTYEVQTISGNTSYIKATDKDEYLQYDNGKFTMVNAKTMLKDNESVLLSSFTISTIAPEPTYEDISIGPTDTRRDGAILKTMTGTLQECKRECSSNAMCIGFNYNNTSSACELKTSPGLNTSNVLSTYIPDTTTQYYFKKGTIGSSDTYTGDVTGFTLGPDVWNTDLTFDDCLDEARSVSSGTVTGVGYDQDSNTCYFSAGTTTDSITHKPDDTNQKMMMCLDDPTLDIMGGCKPAAA